MPSAIRPTWPTMPVEAMTPEETFLAMVKLRDALDAWVSAGGPGTGSDEFVDILDAATALVGEYGSGFPDSAPKAA